MAKIQWHEFLGYHQPESRKVDTSDIENRLRDLHSKNEDHRWEAAVWLGQCNWIIGKEAIASALLRLLAKEERSEVFKATIDSLNSILLSESQKKRFLGILLKKQSLKTQSPDLNESLIFVHSLCASAQMRALQILPNLAAIAFGNGVLIEERIREEYLYRERICGMYIGFGPLAIPSLHEEFRKTAREPKSAKRQEHIYMLRDIFSGINEDMQRNDARFSVPQISRISGLMKDARAQARMAFPPRKEIPKVLRGKMSLVGGRA